MLPKVYRKLNHLGFLQDFRLKLKLNETSDGDSNVPFQCVSSLENFCLVKL